ncbi:MAG: methyltransferase domain-containing protein [Acidobacteriota bacterium]|nr:methyltransferase domain-containing protein [Acidobacteriota bacterium]
MFQKRSAKLELIDTGDYTAAEYEGCLRELRRVNHYLGDTVALRKTLLSEIENKNPPQFSVLDVGAGSGELLRAIAGFARKKKGAPQLIGLELNARSARAILEESKDFAEIFSIQGDALRLPFADASFDYTLCSLFTHHFTDEDVVRILSEMKRVTRRKIYVIDLHRHVLAYFLYTTVGKLFLYNRLVRHDGALSILRSFKPKELKRLAGEANLENVSVERHFPFRLVLSAGK